MVLQECVLGSDFGAIGLVEYTKVPCSQRQSRTSSPLLKSPTAVEPHTGRRAFLYIHCTFNTNYFHSGLFIMIAVGYLWFV